MSLTEKQANLDYYRITGGKRLDISNKPYALIYLDKLICFFENKEEYEKCGHLLKVKNDILNHNNNYCV
jgi:hypothetical protein